MTAEQIEAKKARVAEALRLHDEGLSMTEISKMMGVRYETVRRYLMLSGVHKPKPQDGRSKIRSSKIKRMPCGRVRCYALVRMLYLDYIPVKEIAEIANIGSSAITNQMKREGLGRNHQRMRPKVVNEIVNRAKLGESYYAIAKDIGMNPASVSTVAIKNGIRRGKGGGCVASNNAKRNAEALERVRSELAGRFEVLSLRASRLANLRCCVCGHEFERSVDVRYETTCPECARRIVEENERRRIREHDEHMKASTIVRGFRRFLRYKQNEEQFNQWLDEPHACKECGRTFTMRELREDNPWNFSYKPTFCSKACSNKWNRRNTGYKRRQAIGTSHGISLSKLIRRDNNTCYICGGACDDSDYSLS